jgi:hypothetical protein
LAALRRRALARVVRAELRREPRCELRRELRRVVLDAAIVSALLNLLHAYKIVSTYAAPQSGNSTGDCCAFSRPMSGIPTEFVDGYPLHGLHRRRAGDPQDS